MATTNMGRTEPAAMQVRGLRPGAGALLTSLIFIPVIHAETPPPGQVLTYGVDAGVGETDNVTLAHTEKTSQTMAVADADLNFTEQSSLLDATAKGNFSYIDYLQGAYSDQLLGRFDGNARVALIPQRLTWVLQDDYGQSAVDPFTPTTPTNLENINYVSTGPDLTLRFGGLSFLNLGARVTRAQYQTSPLTSDRASASLAWGYQLSARSSISLNGDTERVLFENTAVNTNFDRSNAFVNYAFEGSRTSLSADLGGTAVDERGTATRGGLATLKLARRLSAATKLTATLGRDLTDGSSNFSSLSTGASGITGTGPAGVTSQNYTANYGSVDWEYQRNRTGFGLSGRWEKDLYAAAPLLDRTMATAEFQVRRQVTRTVLAQITGRWYQSDYYHVSATGLEGSPKSNTGAVIAGMVWRHGRALEIKLQLEHSNYTTSPNGTGYTENRMFLKIGYRPIRDQGKGPDTSGFQ